MEPVALKTIEAAGESSKTTHGVITCIDACRYYSGLIYGALHGTPKYILLSEGYAPGAVSWKDDPLCPEIENIANGSFRKKEPPAIRGTGYVVDSMEAALWAFERSDDFKTGCLMAANLGDDADTTAAIYGQLAGAYYGHKAIPSEWSNKIKYRDHILYMANRLASKRKHQK
ncbi:MAG: ADP-ribosylglycohydrolase family protein [Verrucomicrobiota bacterium]